MVAKIRSGIEIPLHPFFAAMATRRRKARAASQRAAGIMAGNLDNKTSSPARRCTFPCTRPARS